ncbi:uncharacterized protein LOC133791633 [Humulus lupulus]|uniref:uncharacterized protein LOC133791633 n=1 Tax=Humulus lupulus TaxID=3486 RepID=UPI002B4145D3|nr:uncharacterized protein LOC133791633 [Humulus lupulus]
MHLANFIELCQTFKMNGVSNDAIRLRLFPFSLKDRAKSWLVSLPPNSITTWNDLAQKFLSKLFFPAKAAKLREEINNFYQFEEREITKKVDGVHELDAISMLSAQVATLTKQYSSSSYADASHM